MTRAVALAASALSLAAALMVGVAAQEPPTPPAGPWFVDVAGARGLPPGNAHRALFRDLDGDGWPDVVLNNERAFRNVPAEGGGRRFEEVPGFAGLLAGRGRPDLLLLADLDDDGDADAYCGVGLDPGDPNRADPGYRSWVALRDDGGFRAVDAPALALPEAVVAGAFLDYDLDGRLDLVTGANYRSGGGPLEAYPLRLYRGLGGGSFEETTDPAGLTQRPEAGQPDSRRPVYGVTTCDWDGDGWPDILVCAYGRQRNLLYRNRGDGTFAEVGLATGFAGDEDTSGAYPPDTKRFFRERYGQEREDEQPFRSNGNTFDAAPGDHDNDGDLDLFLAEITHAWAGPSSDRSSLLENLGPPTFAFRRDPAAAPRRHEVPNWNQGDLYCAWLDADNDGLLDLLLASGDYPDAQYLRLFRQGPPGRFQDVTQAAGIDWESCAQISLADYDRDGDVDVLAGNSHMRMSAEWRQAHPLRAALFENRVGNRRHWLNVRLEGRGAAAGGANRAGLGARVTVESGEWRAIREVVGGVGHAGHADHYEACFGLGERDRIDRLVIRWPDRERTVTVLEDVPVDRSLLVRQGSDRPVVLGPE